MSEHPAPSGDTIEQGSLLPAEEQTTPIKVDTAAIGAAGDRRTQVPSLPSEVWVETVGKRQVPRPLTESPAESPKATDQSAGSGEAADGPQASLETNRRGIQDAQQRLRDLGPQ